MSVLSLQPLYQEKRKLTTCATAARGFAAAHCGKPTAFRRVAPLETGGEAQPRRRMESGCFGKGRALPRCAAAEPHRMGAFALRVNHQTELSPAEAGQRKI